MLRGRGEDGKGKVDRPMRSYTIEAEFGTTRMARGTLLADFNTLRRKIQAVLKPGQGRFGYLGWTGHKNLGDEILFEAARILLKDYALFPYRASKADRLADWLAGGRLLRGCCLGGGTLIYGGEGYLRAMQAAAGLPMFALGTGVVEPLPGSATADFEQRRGRWVEALRGFRAVSVRGPQSKAMLEAHGLSGVEIVGDPALVFSRLRTYATTEDRVLGVNAGSARGRLWGGDEEPLIATVAQAVRRLKYRGWRFEFFSVWPEDDGACVRLAAAAGLRACAVQKHYRAAEGFLAGVQRCSVFLGMKLHSVILAHCASVPSVMLGYRNKCFDYLASMEMEHFAVRTDQVQVEPLVGLVESAYDQRDKLRRELKEKCAYYTDKLEDFAGRIRGGLLWR